MPWGRDDQDWDALLAATESFLIEQAKFKRTTTYTELNATVARRTGLRPFDFTQESERAAVGDLLGTIAVKLLPDIGALISSLVQYIDANDAGSGFYRLAADQDMLTPKPTADQRMIFWVSQVNKVHQRFS